MIKLDLSRLLEKEMDRKDFLKHVAAAAIALTGAAAVLRELTLQTAPPSQKDDHSHYGSSAYGG